MTFYESLVAEADRLRERAYRPRRAIWVYRQALEVGGPRECHCLQQMGVCHAMLGEHEMAEQLYQDAMRIATPATAERGNIERDRAGSFGARKKFEEARFRIERSLNLLPYDQYPAEHAATLGFQARLLVRTGNVTEALALFARTDRLLEAAGTPKLRLYNLLHWASGLSRAGQPQEVPRVIGQALGLIPGHGSWQHQLRAHTILYGGWRADRALSVVRSAASWAE